MDGAILETDLEVVGVKAGRCVFNAILGDAGCEILPLCFLLILEEVAAKVVIFIAQLDFSRRECYRVCRWLDREICGFQILIIKVDGVDL